TSIYAYICAYTRLSKDLMSIDTLPSSEECNCFAVRAAARHVTQSYDQFLAPTGLRTTQTCDAGHSARTIFGGLRGLIHVCHIKPPGPWALVVVAHCALDRPCRPYTCPPRPVGRGPATPGARAGAVYRLYGHLWGA